MAAENKSQLRIVLYVLLSHIPYGRLVTYGQLAHMVGYPGAARAVARVLSLLPEDTQLPWHRVVAAGGRISLSCTSRAGQEQRQRLQEEGVLVVKDRVKLINYQWQPTTASQEIECVLPMKTVHHGQ